MPNVKASSKIVNRLGKTNINIKETDNSHKWRVEIS